MRITMKIKLLPMLLFGVLLSTGFAQEESRTPGIENGESKDLKVGDIAPSWALMYAPAKFEFLKNWTEEKGKRLRKFQTQPDRYVVVMSFFATWCKPCMKELPILEEVYQKYKDERIKFFLVDITEATRNNPGYENMPKAGPFLKDKGVTMQILFDTRGTVMQRYNAETLPRLFIIDGNRTIRLARRGFQPGEDETFKKELAETIEKLLVELPPPKNGAAGNNGK